MILQSNLLLTELSIIYIESRMQNLPFFVGEWALQHNRPLLPLSVTSLPSSCYMTQFGGDFLSLNDVKFHATAPDPVSQCST